LSQAATSVDTATSAVAAWKTRAATWAAPLVSRNPRCTACSSMSGAFTSSSPGTPAARAYSMAAKLQSE